MQPITITQLNIDRAEALRYLRLPAHMTEADLPPDITTRLMEAETAVLAAAQPRFIWRSFEITGRSDIGIQLSGTSLVLPGADIAALLADCPGCIIMAATLGQAVDDLIRRTQPLDMAQALMLDALASAAVEDLCNQIQNALAAQYAQGSLYLTRRFSPGYGDLPISLQKPLCTTLDTQRRIGLSPNQSGILLPRKSVTAIMGQSPAPPTQGHTCGSCAACNMRATCPYKKGVDTNE